MNIMDKHLEETYISKFEKLLAKDLGFEVVKRLNDIPLGVNYELDGLLEIRTGSFKYPVVLEVMGSLEHLSQIKRFLEFLDEGFEGIAVVIADSIESRIKVFLRNKGIGFYEIDKSIFFPIDFRLRVKRPFLNDPSFIKKTGFRAVSSIKLLLYFLSRPESLSYPQRQIAGELGISLGAVNHSLTMFDELKLVINSGGKHYLGKFEEIVERWRFLLSLMKRKNLSLGRFSPISEEVFRVWKKFDLKKFESYWGGEPAASIRTNYLTPELFTIYTYEENINDLLVMLRLKRDPNGMIEIFKCFWPNALNNSDGTIPDFVTYCELLNSRVDRNLETAEFLKKILKEKLIKYEY
jgi:Transcriptional regulator, AbiEi antitoxin, Type IV TA system